MEISLDKSFNTLDKSLIVYIIVSCIVVGILINVMFFTPKYYRLDEGFFGGIAHGSGHPDCLRTLPEGSEILNVLRSGKNIENSSDYKELQLILSKLACLKKDLLSPSGIVQATLYQSFETAHDRINVAEVCGMCLNQSIASRDLDIVFVTWRDRGNILLTKLCTKAQIVEADVVKLEGLFKKIWEDVYDISKSRCLKTDDKNKNDPGDVGAYESDSKNLKTYDYKYGGLSASGWNGP
jgi:hypothetical protein